MVRRNRILSLVLAAVMLLSMLSTGQTAALAADDAAGTALTLDTPLDAVISEGGQIAYFTFTPEVTGAYVFSSDTGMDTRGYLYDENMNELASDDDSGEGLDFMLCCELTAGTTYIFGACYYDVGYTGTLTVTLTKSPVPKVEVKPLSIMEGTCGVMETIWNGDGEEAGMYYYYRWNEYVQYTLTFDDGTVVEATGDSFAYNGNWYSATWKSDQGSDQQWTVGNTYTAQLSVMGVTVDVPVTITASPVESVTFAPISVAEGLDGEWRTDYNSQTDSYDIRWYYYNWTPRLRYTVTFTDGSTVEGSGTEFEYNGEWYSISVIDHQSSMNPWEPGNSYKVSAAVMGKQVELTVQVTDSPVASVTLEPISLVEDTNGYWMTADAEGVATNYYHYSWWEHLRYSVTFKDGSTLQGWGRSFTYNGIDYSVTTNDPQCAAEPWTVGNTYTTAVGIMGVQAYVSVTIAASPIQDITFDPISIEEGIDCNRRSEWNPETEVNDLVYYHYEWTDYLSYTITFADGTVMKAQGTEFVYDGEAYSLNWNDDQCYSNQWQAGQTYTVTVSTTGIDAEVAITITPTTIQSIVFEPVSVVENFDGNVEYEWNEQTQRYDREYYCYSWWNNLRYTITYTDGTRMEAQGASFIHDGKELYWERMDSQCADFAWEAGNTYTVTVFAAGKEYAVDVSVIDTPVVSVAVTPIQILSGTGGYLGADYIEESDSYSPEYYHYDWIDKLELTVTYADGTVRHETGGSFLYNGSWYFVDYSDGQSYENRWLQGNTYTETVSVLGYEAQVPVTITASTVASITVEPVTITEQTGGYFKNFWNPETGAYDLQVYVYQWWDEISYTITFADGTSYRGSGVEFLYDGQWYSVEFMDDQSDENPWDVGSYTATVVAMGVSAPVSVTIVETPVQRITLDPITVQKGVDDYWESGDKGRSHYYRWFEKLSGTVTFNDGTTAKLDGLSFTYQGERYNLGYEDSQSEGASWAVGGAYTVSVSIMGVTAETTVTVVDTDVRSVVMKPVIMAENCEGSWNIEFGDEGAVEYFCYDWWNAMEYTISFKDGTTVTGMGSDFQYNGEWYRIESFDKQSYSNPLTAGNTYTMDVDVAGYETKVSVQIVTPESDSGYKYLVLDGKAYIVGCTRTDAVLTVPASLGGYEVAGLRGLGDALTTVEELVIPDTVTGLSSDLFYEDMTYIRKVTLGSGITALDSSTFLWLHTLEQINVSENNPAYCSVDGVLYDKAVTTMVTFPKAHQGTHVIPDSVKDVSLIFDDLAEYAGIAIQTGAGTPQYVTVDEVVYTADRKTVLLCSGAKTGSYVMPESVTTIHPTAFCHCGLTAVTVSANVKELPNSVFYECFNLETVLLPEGLESVGHSAFLNCTSVKTVILPASVRYVGGAAFAWCEALDSIVFLGDAPEFDDDVFYGITTRCYYPADNATWTDEVLYGCPGEVTWIPYDETLTDPEIVGKSFSLSFEDEILVNFYYSLSDMTYVTEHGMLVYYAKPGTPDYRNADEVYEDSVYIAETGQSMAQTHGIAAKQMGVTRYYVAYAKLVNGKVVYSKPYEYSPRKYAMNMLGRSTTSDKQKALCVAMLNYGAAAQEFFGYNTSDLMNAGLTEAQKALAAPYDAGLFTGAVAADSSKTTRFPRTPMGFSGKSVSVSFEGAFAINYYFAPSEAVAGEMTFYYWTPEDYAATDKLSSDNATGKLVMKRNPDGSYWAQVSGIAAKNLDKTYYVCGMYTDTLGETYCTGVIAYSLSRYCMNNAVEGKDMQDLAAAAAMYGYYAKEYFAG